MTSTRNDVQEPDVPNLRRVIVAASLGNFVEWFDFAVYGFMATTIARNFFPSDDPTTSLLQTFAVFAAAFALRPLGGLVFGVLGDRIGRRRVLSVTVLLIGGSTTLIGLLPTYASIGILATVLLCLLRGLQGFSAGGEYAGACAYVVEHSPASCRARYASAMPATTFFAFASAAMISFLAADLLGREALDAWGWRIPFLVAAPVGAVGFYIRSRLSETPAFRRLEESDDLRPEAAPLRRTLRTQGRTMLVLGGVVSASGLAFYTFTTYMSSYVQVVGGRSSSVALIASFVALVFASILAPWAGRFSDRIGRRRSTIVTVVLLGAGSIPAFLLAGSGTIWMIIVGQCLLAVGVVLSLVVVAVLMSELFATRIRYTASALTYNVAYTIFGGTAPFVATWLVSRTGSSLSPAIYLMAVSLLALVCALRLPETAGQELRDTDDVGRADHPPGPGGPASGNRTGSTDPAVERRPS